MQNILVPVSPGELLDKITILEIKSERISNPDQKANVRIELKLLLTTWTDSVIQEPALEELRTQLKKVNQELWDIEDEIRAKERVRAFDAQFIELARSVYITNDRRSRIKKELNQLLGSKIVEEKSYQRSEALWPDARMRRGLALCLDLGIESRLTHSDRQRDWPLDAGATFEVNHFETVPIPAKTAAWFSGNE